MSILNKLTNLKKASNEVTRVQMTDDQFERCKAAIRTKNRGYNVHPNRFDVKTPYRVAVNYNNVWANFGNFKSADVAAAVGTIVSAGYFGEKATAGSFEAGVEEKEEYINWMKDERNADIIARAQDPAMCIHESGASAASSVDHEF